MSSVRPGEQQTSSREFFSRLFVVMGALPILFGCFFVRAGYGYDYIVLGIIMIVTGAALDLSRRRVIQSLISLSFGLSPFLLFALRALLQ